MQKSERSFKNLRTKYLLYLIPATITEFALYLNEFADSIIVSNLLDSSSLSIVNIAGPVIFIFSTIYMLLGMGGATLYSISKGNHDHESADALFSASIILAAVVSIILMIVGLLFNAQISEFIGGSLSFGNELSEYIKYLFVAGPPIIITSVFIFFLPASGHPVMATMINIIVNVVNLIFDFIYIKWFNMGVSGAAFATFTGFSVGLIILLVFYFVKGRDIGKLMFSFKALSRLKTICTTGLATATTQIGYAIKVAFCNFMAASYAGQTGVVSFTICMQILFVISVFLGALLNTMTPFLGVLKGQNDNKGSRYIIKITSSIQIISSVAVVAVCELYPKLLTDVYAVDAGPTTDAVIDAVRIFSLLILIRWIYIEFKNVATILGLRLYAFLICIADGFALLIPISLVLCHFIGINGLWWSFLISTVIVCLAVAAINRIIVLHSNQKYKGFWLISNNQNVVADITINSDESGVGAVTLDIEKICRNNGMQMSRAMLAAISVEEMIVITSKYGTDDNIVPIDVLIQRDNQKITLDLRSIGKPFNPTNFKDEQCFDNFEMLRRISKSVTYDYVLGMNTTRIVINTI